MASLTIRRDGRYEIRESESTRRGPRSRTLAIFSELTDAHLDRAAARARGRFDREAILARARELGVPIQASPATRLALELIAQIHRGEVVAPSVALVLGEALGRDSGSRLPDDVAPAVEWLGRSEEERGRAVRELLRLADRIVRSRRGGRTGDIAYPRINSSAA